MPGASKDMPSWIGTVDNPYLSGIYAPVAEETHAAKIKLIAGELPDDLSGAYVRNGPNSAFAPTNLYHWFDGDGMVHALYFRDGEASYRSRFIRTDGYLAECDSGRALWPGVMGPFNEPVHGRLLKDTANTDLVFHRGQLLATWYLCGDVYALDPNSLETIGKNDFGGQLRTRVSAHPKVDAASGELMYFTLADEPPYMSYGVVGADGQLAHAIDIDLPGPRASHDLTITRRYTILHDFPLFHDVELQKKTGHRITRFHRNLPSRFGIVPRYGRSTDVRWYEFEPAYVLHMVNAWEDGDWIIMDGCTQPDPTIKRRPEDGELASMMGYLRVRANLHRWCINLVTGETKEYDLDDLNVEFCLPDTQKYGQKTRYSYHQHLAPDAKTVEFNALVKYDHDTGQRTQFAYGTQHFGSEAPFAPRLGGVREDDGYVVTIVSNPLWQRSSQCWIFDAAEIERGPVARLEIPARVPLGFHAKWIPGQELWSA